MIRRSYTEPAWKLQMLT
ncbi:hypothetical protein DNTS_023116, partial [Danionella cerebrum]